MKPRFFPTPEHFRDWLETLHTTEKEGKDGLTGNTDAPRFPARAGGDTIPAP